MFLQTRQKNIKAYHDSLYQTFEDVQKTRNKWANELKKNDVFFWKVKKNHNMMTEIRSAFSVSISLKAEKTWFVNKKNFNSD